MEIRSNEIRFAAESAAFRVSLAVGERGRAQIVKVVAIDRSEGKDVDFGYRPADADAKCPQAAASREIGVVKPCLPRRRPKLAVQTGFGFRVKRPFRAKKIVGKMMAVPVFGCAL